MERMGGGPERRRNTFEYAENVAEQLPAPRTEADRNIPVEDLEPIDTPRRPEPRSAPRPRQPEAAALVPVIAQGAERTRSSMPSVMPQEHAGSGIGKKIAIGTGIGVGGAFAGTVAASLAGMWGIHRVMNKVGDFFAGPIVKGILKLGELNPFKWAWNKIVGGDGGDSHGHDDHSHGHGGGHAPAHH